MASYSSRGTTPSPRTWASQLYTSTSETRRPSASILGVNASPVHSHPRVQLIPHSRNQFTDASFSSADQHLIDHTYFDSRDVSGKDFDFEDVFTYDKPSNQVDKVNEVTMSAQKESLNYSFSHYSAATNMRQKVNSRVKSTSAAEMYLKNSQAKRR